LLATLYVFSEVMTLLPNINIRSLKKAAKDLPESSLREILLEEADEIDAYEFLIKIDIWLKLAREYKKR
jgi:hypothetical protein